MIDHSKTDIDMAVITAGRRISIVRKTPPFDQVENKPKN
jgi:hypothetical protein